jgi:hypothetical protein
VIAALGARTNAWPHRAALLVVAALAVPPLRRWLDATMISQMLVQIPLLALAGWLLAGALPTRWRARIDPWNRHGLASLALATFASACWMLPRALDAAVAEPAIMVAKFASVPLLIGAPLAIGWPRMNFIVRGVALAEGIATLFRLGWLYGASPVRLCSQYPIEDQQRLGACLFAIGAAALAAVAWKLLFGRFDDRIDAPSGDAGYHWLHAR